MMDEKLKHRLIGLAVIVSLFILVIPFLIKKNQPDLTELAALTIEQPSPAPVQPSLTVEPVHIDFTTLQVAQVDLDRASSQVSTAVRPTLAMVPEDEFTPSSVDPDYLPGEIMPMEPEWVEPEPPEPIKPIKPVEPAKPLKPQPQMPEPEPEREPEPVVQAVPGQGKWVVQLGSFANRANADALFKKLQAKGFTVFANTSANAQGTLITRILVGPHVQRQQAEQMREKLEQAVQLRGIVIQWNG